MISHTTPYEEDFFKNYYDKQITTRWYNLKNLEKACEVCGITGTTYCKDKDCPNNISPFN